MAKFLLIVACIVANFVVPYKGSTEFTVKLDYNFKPRPPRDNNVHIQYEPHATTSSSAVLPFLTVNLTLDSLNHGETRVKISDNKNGFTSLKKVRVGSKLSVEVGFTDDAKDRVTANEFTLVFINADKTPVNKIEIKIDGDGNFFVNNEKRGKF